MNKPLMPTIGLIKEFIGEGWDASVGFSDRDLSYHVKISCGLSFTDAMIEDIGGGVVLKGLEKVFLESKVNRAAVKKISEYEDRVESLKKRISELEKYETHYRLEYGLKHGFDEMNKST